jgi:hypothetical protein
MSTSRPRGNDLGTWSGWRSNGEGCRRRGELERLRRAAARCGSNSGEGKGWSWISFGQGLAEEVAKQLAKGIGMGWRGEEQLQRGAAAVVRCRVEEKRHCSWKKRGNVTRFVVALAHRREKEEWRKGGPRLGSGLQRRGGGRQAPRGHRGVQRRGQRGEATAAAGARVTRGGGQQESNSGEAGRGRARGGILSPAPEVKRGRAEGVQRKKKGKEARD